MGTESSNVPRRTFRRDGHTRLNYVIPSKMEAMLAQYCAQTEMKPGPLVRRLISDFIKGDIDLDAGALEHPHGRRTSVDLPVRLLDNLEERCAEIGVPTKAALIAGLLNAFLPSRVDQAGIEKIAVSIPTTLYNQVNERYGPVPIEKVLVEALSDLIQKNPTPDCSG